MRDLVETGVDVQRARDLFIYLVEDSGAIFDSRARSRLLERPGLNAADPRSVEKWLELLEDTLLLARVDPFTRAATARLGGRARPKFYARDHALVVAFASTPDPLTDPVIAGHVLETAVARHLRQLAPDRVTYYRAGKAGSREADFVVEKARRRIAVEVTHAQDTRDKIDGLIRSMADVKADAAVIIHGGLAHGMERGVRLLPRDRFLLDPEVVWNGGEG
jgi:predicted AAA+ superfamily ATPase